MWMLWGEVSAFPLFPLLKREKKKGKWISLFPFIPREPNGDLFSGFILSRGN